MSRVYLHAAGHNRGLWAGQVEGLCLDLPGHGAAPRVTPPTVDEYARAVLPQLPERPVLIGHSLGGMVALALGRLLNGACRALVLLDAPIKLPFARFRRAVDLTTRLAAPKLFSHGAGMRTRDRETRRAIQQAVGAMTPAGMRDAALAASFFDGRPDLAASQVPILGLYSRSAAIAGPFAAHAVRKAQPRAQVEMMRGGHMFPLEQRAHVEARICQFLETHP